MMGDDIELRASAYAAGAHADAGHRRKYTGAPYIEHPCAVAALVRTVSPDDAEMLAAAWLHDVVEDTGRSLGDIEMRFGHRVATLVEQLTDVSKLSDGNRAVRKAKDREHTSQACPEAKTIKLTDLIDNSRSILTRDPEFGRVHLAEKRALLSVLREGSADLWKTADEIVQTGLVAS